MSFEVGGVLEDSMWQAPAYCFNADTANLAADGVDVMNSLMRFAGAPAAAIAASFDQWEIFLGLADERLSQRRYADPFCSLVTLFFLNPVVMCSNSHSASWEIDELWPLFSCSGMQDLWSVLNCILIGNNCTMCSEFDYCIIEHTPMLLVPRLNCESMTEICRQNSHAWNTLHNVQKGRVISNKPFQWAGNLCWTLPGRVVFRV